MDVLIIEHDGLLAAVLADALTDGGISVVAVPDENEAMAACRDDPPRLVITSINRRGEDMKGLQMARAMRARWPGVAAVYLAALWPVLLHRRGLDIQERLLSKPVGLGKLVQTVRELLPA
jgi:DNA-binding response OmpR family regulator